MEISNLNVCGLMVRFGFVCKTCKQAVEVGDKFCRNCGRELEQLDRVAKVTDVASILTEAFKGRKAAQHKANEVSIEGERTGSASSMCDDDAKIESNKKRSGLRGHVQDDFGKGGALASGYTVKSNTDNSRSA